jgi:hypothetical protein
MRNLAIDPTTGDLLKRAGNMQKVTGLDALAQNLNSFLQTQQGEVFIDPDLGIDWVHTMADKSIDVDIKNTIIKNAILSRPFVTGIIKYESEYVNTGGERQLQITVLVQSSQGVFGINPLLEVA